MGCHRFAAAAHLGGVKSLITLEGREVGLFDILRYIECEAVELLHQGSVLLLRDRAWVLAALNIALSKMLLGCLVLMLLLVEHALEL